MKPRISIALLICALCAGNLYSQDFNKARLDSLLDLLAANNKAMGSLVISKDGRPAYSKAIGYAHISAEGKIPATVTTAYRIGSITKMFTATMIFQLIEEKKLSLNTTLSKYYPQFPNATKVTIGHLLGHRSGLFSITSDPDFPNWMTQPISEDDLVARMAKHPVDFQPDEKFSYSNTNYILLGLIIERVTKTKYADNLARRITTPVGLTRTYYGGKMDPNRSEALSYSFLNDWTPAPETDMSIPRGAGALLSTPTDLAKFIETLFAGKLVSTESLNQMKTIKDGMGMGMFSVPFHTKQGYGHNGRIDGSSAVVFHFPEDAVTIAYCSNGVVYPVNDILIGALSIFQGMPYNFPDFNPNTNISLTESDLEKYLGVYSSTQLPLKITITKDKTQLLAQATGQPAFPLEPTDSDKFKFEPAGIIMEFNPDKSELTLKQGGGTFTFTRNN